jgi:hypothetical protein
MRALLVAIAISVTLALSPLPSSAQPGQPQIGAPTLGASTVSFPVTWTASTAPYTWSAGYNDTNGGQPNSFTGSAGSNSTTITIPYHFDGLASSAFICVTDANSLTSCNSFNVPAKPVLTETATVQWKSGDNCSISGQSCQFSVWRCSPVGCSNFAQIGVAPQVNQSLTQTFVDTNSPLPSACYEVRDDCSPCTGNSNFTNVACKVAVPNPPINFGVH